MTSSTPPGPETPAAVPSPAVNQRNFRYGVMNGVLFSIGDSMSSASLVLALLVRQLGGSLELIGLLPALQSGGYLLPQILVGGRLQAMPYKLPVYRRAAMARLLAFLGMTGAVFAVHWLSPGVSLLLIMIFFSVFNLGGGTSMLAFQDVVAKVIPARRRGNFFGTRQLGSGLLAFAIVGPLVRWLLGSESPLAFPENFGVLCLLAVVGYGTGMWAFGKIDEPPQTRVGPRLRLADGLRRAPAIMRENHNYRWFIISRMLTRIGQIAEPFYIIYATEMLHLPVAVAGVFLALRAIVGALSNLVWSRMSDRQGNRRLVLFSGMLMALHPALAIIGPLLASSMGLGSTGMLLAMGLVFVVSGAAQDASNLAGNTYLLDIVPETERPIYMGLANTTLGLVTFTPVLGGVLVHSLGYQGTFVLGLGFALLGILASLRLSEHERVHVTPTVG